MGNCINTDKDKKKIYECESGRLQMAHNIYRFDLFGASFIHAFMVFAFFTTHHNGLALFNVFSTLFYIVAFIIYNDKRYKILLVLTIFEIFVFAALTTLHFAWEYNFFLYFLLVIPLAYTTGMEQDRAYNKKLAFGQIIIYGLLFVVISFIMFDIGAQCNMVRDNFGVIFRTVSIINYGGVCMLLLTTNFAFIANISHSQNKLRDTNAQLKYVATHDPLTDLINRRSMGEYMSKAEEKYEKEQTPFSFIIADIDNFKKVNDVYGHESGDIVLQGVSRIIKDTVPEGTNVCRWGGEEILILVYDNLENTIKVAEEIRANIEKTPFVGSNTSINVTVTMGVEEYDSKLPINKIISLADDKLYKGKTSTKNCVVAV